MTSTRSSIYIPDKIRKHLDLDLCDSLSNRMAAICDRYAWLLMDQQPKFRKSEWLLILAACNGWATWAEAGESLMLGLASEVHDHISLNRGHEQWDLTEQQGYDVARRLAEMPAIQRISVVELVERFWRRHQMATDEAMQAAGIVPVE